MFVQEDTFNEVLNTPVIPTHFPTVWMVEVRIILISSHSLEFGGIDTCIGLKTALFCRNFSLLTFITSML